MKKVVIFFCLIFLFLGKTYAEISIVLKETDVLNYTIPPYTESSIPDMFTIHIGFYLTEYDLSFDFVINDEGISNYKTDVQPDTTYYFASVTYKTPSCSYAYGETEILTDMEFNKLQDGVTGQIIVHGGPISIRYMEYNYGVAADEESYFPITGQLPIEDYTITVKTLNADFEADKTSGEPPLTVNFIDKSTGVILGYSWDFGYGNTSNKKKPINTYTQPGDYTVSLTLTGLETTDTETKTDYIHVSSTAPVLPCFVEHIYGESAEEVRLLRYFRNNVLSKTPEGQEIIKLYYQWSPAIVKVMENDGEFKEEVKEMIDGVLELITEEPE